MEKAQTIFGRRVRVLRKERRLTIEGLGKLASLGYKHVADIERGVKAPSFDAIDRLAAALHVEPQQLFIGEPASEAAVNRELRKLFERVHATAPKNTKSLLVVMLELLTATE